MARHHAYANGYATDKKRDDDHRAFSDRDLESKYIWNMHDLEDDEKESRSFFKPSRPPRTSRSRLIKQLLAAAIIFFVCLYYFLPSQPYTYSGSDPTLEIYDIETLRYYDLSDNVGTSVGWEREERVLLCTPLRDAAPHLPMFFAHLRNFTYPHHLIDLGFLVSDSKDNTESLLTELLEGLQNDENPSMPYGEISVIHKDFGQSVSQDVESRHGFAAQASRRKLMAQARNWLLSAALRPYHSWVYWRDADVETCPFTILEDLMRHDKDVIVPSKYCQLAVWLI
jgi:mannan polymerase II complex ANP1 subunit